MKILFFGDIVGKIGRRAVREILPELKKEFSPDLILANAENIAHGTGVTETTLKEMQDAGVDLFTSGNHVFDKPEGEILLSQKDSILLRPANYPPQVPGKGYKVIEVATKQVVIINLLGRVFIREDLDCPFRKLDEILAEVEKSKPAAIIVDFHAEATSEKIAFGYYTDGRVTAVLGTHTHVPTADQKILPKGTAFVSDVGMVGAANSVIGVSPEPVLAGFLDQTPQKFDIPQEGEVDVNAVFLEIDQKTKKVINFQRVDRKIKV